MRNANVNNIASTMEQCGLVIFDSHGTTDYEGSNEDYTSRANSSYLCIETTTGITEQDVEPQQGPYDTYYHCMKGSGYANIDGTCIANHMTKDAPHSLLYMGICLGMATDGMHKGLREKGVEVIYGYSQSVTFYGEQIYMESILGYVKDGNTFGEAVMKTKQEHGNWDPAYKGYSEAGARRNHAAYPIVVSSEDVYPGHGNVDAVQNVYSEWSLYKQYEITAVANDDSFGTVSVSGSRITAEPKEGYFAEGYEILSGTATVTQNGNVFSVDPETDCTIQINFAARQPAVITYMADGKVFSKATCMTADVISLPDNAEAPVGWTFVGWSENVFEKTDVKPVIYAPSASYEVTGDAVLHAVYTMVEGYREDIYELVTDAPADWTGRYVITSGKTADMYVMKGIASGKSYETAYNGGQEALADTGMALSDGKLLNVTDSYTFDIAKKSNKYTIQSTDTGAYVAVTSKKLQTVKSYSALSCTWTLEMSGEKAMAKAGVGRYLSFDNGVFCALTSSPGIYLWKQAPQGTVYYATQVTEPEKPSFYGISVVLSGQIGMNFYVTIPEPYQESARMAFRIGDTESDAIPASDVSHEGTLYHFTCDVTSVEMADTITVVFSYEDKGRTEEIVKETSVENYLNTIVEQADNVAAYKKAEMLAKALNNYGYYAQLSLPDGPNHVKMAELYDDLALPESIEGFDVTAEDNEFVTQRSFSLSLDSRTTLNFYLSPYETVSAQNITVTDRYGNEVDNTATARVDSWYILSIPDISAHMLGDAYTVKINGNDAISASALSYVQKVQTNDSLSQADKDTAMALYGYYLEAITYAK